MKWGNAHNIIVSKKKTKQETNHQQCDLNCLCIIYAFIALSRETQRNYAKMVNNGSFTLVTGLGVFIFFPFSLHFP